MKNCAYIAGSSLLADQLSPEERSRPQGLNDLLLNFGSAVSQAGRGVVYAVNGFGIVAVTAAVVPPVFAVWRHLQLKNHRSNDDPLITNTRTKIEQD